MASLAEQAAATTARVRKFVRYKEGCAIYSMGRDKFMKLAKDAGAVYKIEKLVLVNTELIDRYLESFRVPADDYMNY